MTKENAHDCDSRIESLWACWPDFESIPDEIIAHAHSCRACGTELESLRGACRRSLSWRQALPASRFARLAASTRAALKPRRAPRPLIWAPALALAAACLMLLKDRRPAVIPLQKPVPAASAEVVKDIDFLDRMDFIENLDMVEAMVPDQPPAP